VEGQQILSPNNDFAAISSYLTDKGVKNILLVHGQSARKLEVGKYFLDLPRRLGIEVRSFTDFSPNPAYDSVVKGVEILRRDNCDAIAAIGGGSAMDVAKCIKLFAELDPNENYLRQEARANDILLLVAPTTAGTGSEATKYAVIYYEGKKQSVTHESIIPAAVCFDSDALKNLPEYHRKAAMLDAMCHAVEAWWSVNSDNESRKYSAAAIKIILANYRKYLAGDEATFAAMMQAANLAGKAINITRTTAGHAMCYGLTSRFGFAHGHAAALCNAALWPYMLEHIGDCVDPRGGYWVQENFLCLDRLISENGAPDAPAVFSRLIDELELDAPVGNEADIEELTETVNPERLRNNPVRLDRVAFRTLYQRIFKK